MREMIKMTGSPEIPGFTLLERCGRGSAGEVWLGYDRKKKLQAVRMVSKRRNPVLAAAERRGVQLYRPYSGRQANLMKILEVGETADYLYCITEPADNISRERGCYVPDTLERRLESGRLTSAEILNCLKSILDGICYLHERRISHGDLKPENILFVNGVLKIGDPGLVSSLDSYCSGGSAGFRPPWNARGKECDIYAFGKMIYMLCTQENPRHFPEIPEQCDLSEFMPLNEIALRCCEYSPRRRFRDAGEIRQALDRVRNGRPARQDLRRRAE